jgi:hypothetical protein
MERQDERPRAHPEGEAARYEDGAPEEGPAAADAAREYTDTGTEGADADTQAATATARSEPAGAPSAAPVEGQAASATGSQFAGSGTAERERAYDDAAERKAVMPPDGDAGTMQPGARAAEAGTAGADVRAEQAAQASSEATDTDQRATETDAQAARAEASGQTADDSRWAGQAGDQTGDQAAGAATQTTPGGVSVAEQPAVLSPDDSQTFRGRWESIQGTFIDDPHGATEQADALVGEVMERLSQLRNDYIRDLRQAIGDGSDTEAMRVALTRYRAFFLMLIG